MEELKPDDYFALIPYADSAWRAFEGSVQATDANKRMAKNAVRDLPTSGGTNIYEALEVALEACLCDNPDANVLTSMIVFLTDGQATTGNTDNEEILSSVRRWNDHDTVSIHSIAFGNEADFELLKAISLQNNGLARKVHEDYDAALQMEGFYAEISNPLLTDLKILYLNETVQVDSLGMLR